MTFRSLLSASVVLLCLSCSSADVAGKNDSGAKATVNAKDTVSIEAGQKKDVSDLLPKGDTVKDASSDDTSVAKVDPKTGEITAVGPGTATVTIKTSSGTTVIKVSVKAASATTAPAMAPDASSSDATQPDLSNTTAPPMTLQTGSGANTPADPAAGIPQPFPILVQGGVHYGTHQLEWPAKYSPPHVEAPTALLRGQPIGITVTIASDEWDPKGITPVYTCYMDFKDGGTEKDLVWNKNANGPDLFKTFDTTTVNTSQVCGVCTTADKAHYSEVCVNLQ
jgi:hypothetical protein